MSTEVAITIELEESEIDAIQQEYGELLGIEYLIKEIVLNNLKMKKDMTELKQETNLLYVGAAKLNAQLGRYDQLMKTVLGTVADQVPQPEPTAEVETITISAADTVTLDDVVQAPEAPQPVRVGLDVQKVAPPSSVPAAPVTVTNDLLQGDANMDAKVKEVMEQVREKNKAAAAIAAQRKGATNVHQGGIVASQ